MAGGTTYTQLKIVSLPGNLIGNPRLNEIVPMKVAPKDFIVGKENFVDLEKQSTYKYILNIDGHVKAFRLGNELRMGSVILLVQSSYSLWFQKFMEPKVHYIPIKLFKK